MNTVKLLARKNDIRLVSSDTPWGKAQSVSEVADGIFSYSTSSHGGYKLSPRRNAEVLMILKKATCGQLGMKGWYEEDCDWAIVVYSFPQFFGRRKYDQAVKSLKTHHAEAWKQI